MFKVGRVIQLAVSLLALSSGDAEEGLARKYRGDEGIQNDPSVVFAESFEEGTLDQIAKRWGEASDQGKEVLRFSQETPKGARGQRSLEMTAILGENHGGHLYTRLAKGLDKAYARFYVRFAEDAPYIHHFVTLGGYNPPTGYPQGGAGEKPRGNERFTVGIEPYGNYGRFAPPGAWNFYAYWMDMKGSADGKFWGNSLTPATPALVPRGRWQCVEVMVKCNSAPEKSDGALALWLDGKQTLDLQPGTKRTSWTGLGFSVDERSGTAFEGFRWRTDPRLNVNFFWLLHYVTENAARQNRVAEPNKTSKVWFDNIVIGSEYIGPICE
jgi:hypothetical protein